MSISLWIVGWRRVFFRMPQHLPELDVEFEIITKNMIGNSVKYRNLRQRNALTCLAMYRNLETQTYSLLLRVITS